MFFLCIAAFFAKRKIEQGSLEIGEASNESIDAPTKVFVVYSTLPGIHCDQGVSNDVFEEGADVNLAQGESQRFCVWIAEHDKFVTRLGFEYVELVR